MQKSFDSAGVVSLEAEWQDSYVFLRGDIQGLERDSENLRGCRVYFAQYPPDDAPCDTCPIEYQGYDSFGREVVQEKKFFCRIPVIERNQVYFFKAYLVGPKDVLGFPSNTVKVVVK